MQTITRRKCPIIFDKGSLRITLTNELLDIGLEISKEKALQVSVIEHDNEKYIVIERVSEVANHD